MNKNSKRYMRDLKLFLPIHGEKEKLLFSDIRTRINELITETPNLSYEQICEELGTPQEIVSEYFFNSDCDYLSKKLRYTQYVRRTFIALIIVFLILTGVRSHYLHKLYLEVKEDKNIPTYFIETIE